jgi:hypothetical protein
MPSQMLAVIWIISTGEQVGEKVNSFSRSVKWILFQMS